MKELEIYWIGHKYSGNKVKRTTIFVRRDKK